MVCAEPRLYSFSWKLLLKSFFPLPLELANSGYLEVRLGLADGGRGDDRLLEPEEFWWLFHLLADNRWARAAAADQKTGRSLLYSQPNELENTELYPVYSKRLSLIEWHLACRAELDFTQVRALFPLWLKPWIFGPGDKPAPPAKPSTKKAPPSRDNYDWSKWK